MAGLLKKSVHQSIRLTATRKFPHLTAVSTQSLVSMINLASKRQANINQDRLAVLNTGSKQLFETL